MYKQIRYIKSNYPNNLIVNSNYIAPIDPEALKTKF